MFFIFTQLKLTLTQQQKSYPVQVGVDERNIVIAGDYIS